MFDSIQTAMAYVGGEADAVRKCDPRLFDSDTEQGNRHDVSWAKMQLSLYVIENEAAKGFFPLEFQERFRGSRREGDVPERREGLYRARLCTVACTPSFIRYFTRCLDSLLPHSQS